MKICEAIGLSTFPRIRKSHWANGVYMTPASESQWDLRSPDTDATRRKYITQSYLITEDWESYSDKLQRWIK